MFSITLEYLTENIGIFTCTWGSKTCETYQKNLLRNLEVRGFLEHIYFSH